ncbi:MAG TPA: hypothetical protein DDZ11_00220 [Lentisphaeria bacterium]|nr:hypothetical protein [Lentisphaeria bacterium]
MFYVNVDTQLFCKSPEEPKRSGEKPWFRHLEGKTFSVAFLHADGTALDLTGKEIVVAIDNNFSHSDAMISHPGQNSATILDAKGGVAQITVQCNSPKFGKIVGRKANVAKMEIAIRKQDGDGYGTVVLQDDGIVLKPRVFADEGTPPPIEEKFYFTKAEVLALFARHGIPEGEVFTKDEKEKLDGINTDELVVKNDLTIKEEKI